MAGGRLFQTRGPAMANALSPSDIVVRGMSVTGVFPTVVLPTSIRQHLLLAALVVYLLLLITACISSHSGIQASRPMSVGLLCIAVNAPPPPRCVYQQRRKTVCRRCGCHITM